MTAVLPGPYHHERWDGTAIRKGSEETSRCSPPLGVADFYDAVTSPRSYRAAISQDEASR